MFTSQTTIAYCFFCSLLFPLIMFILCISHDIHATLLRMLLDRTTFWSLRVLICSLVFLKMTCLRNKHFSSCKSYFTWKDLQTVYSHLNYLQNNIITSLRRNWSCDFNAQIKTAISTSSLDKALIWNCISLIAYIIWYVYYRGVSVLPYCRNITVYCSFILQYVMHYRVI